MGSIARVVAEGREMRLVPLASVRFWPSAPQILSVSNHSQFLESDFDYGVP